MKRKSAINLAVVVVLIIAFGALAIFGLNIGALEIKPLASGISQGLDLRGGVSAVYEAVDDGQSDYENLLSGTMAVLRNRLTGQGFTEATVTQQGTNRIRVEVPDVDDPNEILTIIGQPAKLEFKTEDGTVIMDGGSVKSAEMGYYEGAPVVQFSLNGEGTDAFAKATAENIGKRILIVLDDEVISDPTVNTAITGGEGFIEGQFTAEYAQSLAMLIQSGALPLDIEQLEVRTISATLGEDAIDRAMLAGAIGIAIIFVFMIVMYRLPGLMADLALAVYILIVFYVLAEFQIQLTLPGIAGILLGIGMAVDSNVVIFERFREELKRGLGYDSAFRNGFKNALRAIIDSSVTTLIAAFVLMYFGTGPIKGFSYTLTLGVITSLITAVFVTRFLFKHALRLGFTKRSLYTR